MRKIIFFVVKSSNDNISNIFFKENSNSLFDYREGKFFFDSKFNLPEEIDVKAECIKFDEFLYDNLILLKDLSIKKAKNLSKEKIGKERTPGSLDGIIYSQVDKSYYEKPISIFYFCAMLFVKILMEHKLRDGNKRVAILFLISLLRYLGYHLDWSQGIMQNYEYYESQMETFVKQLEKGYNEINIKGIEVWIKNHSTIAIEWR